MNQRRPEPSEHAPYFSRYIDLVPEKDICAALELQLAESRALFSGIGESRAGHRYAEGKWSIRELLGHVVDGERIFGYRAVCIARGDKQSMPGFDENTYAANGGFERWALADLIDAFEYNRRGNILALRHLPDEAWDLQGVANQNATTPRAVAYTMLGHERHHLNVLRERYL